MPSPGKSGSVFYLSDDDRFMIKSLRGEEVAALLAMLPKYYEHCKARPSTLLTRFLGLHRVKPATGLHGEPTVAFKFTCLHLALTM